MRLAGETWVSVRLSRETWVSVRLAWEVWVSVRVSGKTCIAVRSGGFVFLHGVYVHLDNRLLTIINNIIYDYFEYEYI